MRILILPQVYPPETHPTAVMFHELATAAVERGHEVTVACGYPHHPRGDVLGGYRKRLLTREVHDGVTVLRGWHPTSLRRDIPTRAAVMAFQAMAGTLAAQLGPRPDVILNIGPPLVGPLLGSAVARRFRSPLVTVIFDIYPDVAIRTGKVRSRPLIAAARLAERMTYRASDMIVVLSSGFQQQLASRGVPSHKLKVIPVWLNESEIRPMSRDTRLRCELGLRPDDFVVLYAGTIGLVSGATVVAEAARLVKDPRVHFLFIGEGDALADVERLAQASGCRNVHFAPFQPRDRLSEVQASGDLGIVTLSPGMGRTSVPSKVLGYMAAGRPILASVDEDSDTAALVRAIGGTVVGPGDPQALAAAVDHLATADLRGQAERARLAFEETFTARAATSAYLQLLRAVAAVR